MEMVAVDGEVYNGHRQSAISILILGESALALRRCMTRRLHPPKMYDVKCLKFRSCAFLMRQRGAIHELPSTRGPPRSDASRRVEPHPVGTRYPDLNRTFSDTVDPPPQDTGILCLIISLNKRFRPPIMTGSRSRSPSTASSGVSGTTSGCPDCSYRQTASCAQFSIPYPRKAHLTGFHMGRHIRADRCDRWARS